MISASRWRESALGWTAVSCAVSAAVVVATLSLQPRLSAFVLLAVLGSVALVAMCVVEVHVLPTIALATCFAVSDRMADYDVAPLLAPASLVMVLWWLRKQRSGPDQASAPAAPVPGRRPLLLLSLLLAAWTVPLLLISSSPRLGLSWVLTFGVAVVAPLTVRDLNAEAALLQRWLPWLGAAAAGYAVVESLVGDNLVFNPILRALGSTSGQHWAVYRSESSFGHPLVAGLVFAVVLVFCAGRWLETRRSTYLLLAGVNGAGMVSTVSRGSYIAAAVGIAALVALGLLVGRRLSRTRSVAMVVGFSGLVYLALQLSAFSERQSSAEALASVLARSNTRVIALDAARAHSWLGAGPANSLSAAAPYNFQELPIENSFYQLLISLGAPGLALFCALLVGMLLIAYRRHNYAAVAAVTAFSVACSGFAALDTRRDLIVLLGLLLVLCLAHSPASISPDGHSAWPRRLADEDVFEHADRSRDLLEGRLVGAGVPAVRVGNVVHRGVRARRAALGRR